ncbi:MAG: alanine racemase [Clostridiales bacterium]|nr:alanine racemase [Clostridiales bacterium]
MFRDYRPLWVEIDLDNLKYNIDEIKTTIGKNTEYISVVKANGYGHGAVETAKICRECGINWFAVAMLDEAMELRNAGFDSNILILGYTPSSLAHAVVENGISQTCFSYELAEKLSEAARDTGKTAKIHIAVDTGMGRIGFLPDERSAKIIKEISSLPNLKIEGIFTHFASADERDKEYTYTQFKRFTKFLDILKSLKVDYGMRHAGNSACLMDLPDFDLDAVRPGIIQYGMYPSDEVMKGRIKLKPVMSVKANIVHVKEVEAGTSISYGRKFKAQRRCKIATIPIGYADGYTRVLFNKAQVIVNGKLAPVVGNICMDQCMVDVTDAGDVNIGDEAVIMGKQGDINISAEDIASQIGTINYEVVCMFSKRVPRVYIRDGKAIKVKSYVSLEPSK